MTDKDDILTPDPPENETQIRCPRLGHEIHFGYCKKENNGLPCFKTLDCWFTHFDVHTHLKNEMSEEDFEKIFLHQSKPKILSLFDLIQQAKERGEKSN